MERNHSIFNRVTASVLAFVMTLSMALPSMQIAYAADISDGQKYSVKIEESEHGKIIFSNTDEDSKDFSPGDTVTLNAAPDDGYALDALDVLISQDVEEDDLNFSSEDDEYTFTMPESDVTVAATFAPTETESSSAEEDTEAESEDAENPEDADDEEETSEIEDEAPTEMGEDSSDDEDSFDEEETSEDEEGDSDEEWDEELDGPQEDILGDADPDEETATAVASDPVIDQITTYSADGTKTLASEEVYTQMFNEGGDRLADRIKGLSYESLLGWLGKHASKNDNYYIGTEYPTGSGYKGSTDYRNPNGDIAGENGKWGNDNYADKAGMNCTGFVWHALWKASAYPDDYDYGYDHIPGLNSSTSGSTKGWRNWLKNKKIEYKYYYLQDDYEGLINYIINDDYVDPGDILWLWDEEAVDGTLHGEASLDYADFSDGVPNASSAYHHVGILTLGYFDNDYDPNCRKDEWWDSCYNVYENGEYQENARYAVKQNSIKEIEPKSRCYRAVVVKIGNPETSFSIHKSTTAGYEGIVEDNDNYSLAGATYCVYGSKADAEKNENVLRTLTTSDSGDTSTIKKVYDLNTGDLVDIEAGQTYYIREISPSPGYRLNDEIYDVTTDVGGSKTVEVEDPPIYATLSIDKVDADNEATSLSMHNIWFFLRYYLNADDDTQARFWTMRTRSNGDGTYTASFDKSHTGGGSDTFYTDPDGNYVIPLGYMTVGEVRNDYSGDKITSDEEINQDFTAEGMWYTVGENTYKWSAENNDFAESGGTSGALPIEITYSSKDGEVNGTTDNQIVIYVGAFNKNAKFTCGEDAIFLTAYDHENETDGSITIHKIDKDTKESLAGATFNLIDSDGNVVKPTGDYADVFTYSGEYNDAKTTDEGYMDSSGLITIPDGGYVTIAGLPEGNYTIKEVSAPAGYVPASNDASVTVEAGENAEKDVENTQAAIGLGIEKKDAESGQKTPQGAASFDGATYQIKAAETITIRGTTYNSGDVVATLTLKYDSSKGSYYAETANDALGIGKYTITESSAPTGYQAASDVTVTVTDNGTGDGKLKVTIGSADTKTVDNNTIVEMTSEETILHFGLKIPKQDRERVDAGQSNASEPQGKATFKGVVYEIYNANSTSVWIDLNGGTNYTEYKAGDLITTITSTNDDGSISLPAVLPYGKYEVKETEPPEGYLNSGYDQVLPTDAFLNEIDSSKKDGEIYEATEQPNNEQVERFGFSIHKIDEETQIKDTPEGDADLKAEFEVVNESDHSVQVDGKWYNTGDVVWTFTTDANGAYTSASNLLPYGKYLIREVKASTGYLGPEDVGTYARAEDGTYEIHFEYTEGTDKDGDVKDLGYTIEEPVIRSGLAVQKVDEELLAWLMASYPDYDWEGMTYAELHETLEALDIYWAQGDGELGLNDTSINKDTSTETTDVGTTFNLSDAEFTIYNKSAKAVLVDKNQDGTLDVATELFEPGEAVYVMYTDKYGYAETPLDLLPYGTYQVVETSSPEGYLGKSDVGVFSRSEDGTYYIGEESGNSVTIREEGKLYTKDDKDNYFGIYIEDPVVRGGVTVQKRDAEQKNSGETSGFGDTTPEGSALLSGTVYNIYNLSNHNVLVDKNGNGTYDEDELFKPYQLVYTITTDESGIASYVIRAQSSFFMQTAGRILHTRKILPALYITDADCSVLHPSSAQTSL